jgi:hypothetical protein
MHLGREDNRSGRIVKYRIDPTSCRPIDRYLGESPPSRVGDPKQLLHDARLDVIPNEGSRIGVQADGQVRSERVGYRYERWDARIRRPKLELIEVTSADTGRFGQTSQWESRVEAKATRIGADHRTDPLKRFPPAPLTFAISDCHPRE